MYKIKLDTLCNKIHIGQKLDEVSQILFEQLCPGQNKKKSAVQSYKIDNA